MSTNCFFCPTNRPKPKDSSFTIITNKDKKQIFKFKELEPVKKWTFILEK